MFNRIRAVHIAVNNVDEAAREYADSFGIEATRSGPSPALGIRNAILPVGDAIIELIEPLNAGEGPVARFLESRGEGVYMMALEVDNLDSAIEALQAKGVRLIAADPESRAKGALPFIHPKSSHGVLIELMEKP